MSFLLPTLPIGLSRQAFDDHTHSIAAAGTDANVWGSVGGAPGANNNALEKTTAGEPFLNNCAALNCDAQSLDGNAIAKIVGGVLSGVSVPVKRTVVTSIPAATGVPL